MRRMTKVTDVASHEKHLLIKDAQTAVEDVAGSIHTTSSLMDSLIGDIERMQHYAHEAEKSPASVSPSAVANQLPGLWALAAAISERLESSKAILDAITDQREDTSN